MFGPSQHVVPFAAPMTHAVRDRLQAALGPAYTLERELGGGGMSRVFVARDGALGREVVVKVLPPDAAAAVSVQRFEREIALAARLQHPNIVPVLAAGATGDGLPFYTMPFVEGESLRQRLARDGELPVGEAVSVLRDVGRALAYAHARGVVHRDIKPDNVLLSGGAAVVTDFGVAKALTASATSEGVTSLTQLGIALGTPAYMAPEQASADPSVDHRADLYALGCLAYELLTGQPPFFGRPPTAMLAAHVAEAPEPVERRRPNVPPRLAALVMQCLEKRPADRPRSADEVLRALDAAVATPTTLRGTSATSPSSPERAASDRRAAVLRALPWALSAVLAAALGTALLARRDGAATRTMVTALTPPDGLEFVRGPHFALAPDGRRLVFAAVGRDGRRQLWLRRMDAREAAPLSGTDNASWPFWSPDGREIGYFAAGRLRTIGADGEVGRDLCPAPSPRGGTWGTSGVILFTPLTGSGVHRVRAGGGPCAPLTRVAAGEVTHRRPDFLPDGRHFLFHSLESLTLYVGDAETGEYRVLLRAGVTNALFAPPHFVIYASPVSPQWVAAQRIDLRRLELVGDPTRLVNNVYMVNAELGASASREGVLVVGHVGGWLSKRLVWTDRRGAVLDSLPFTHFGTSFALSHSGRRIAFGSRGVWIHDLDRNVEIKVDADSIAGRPDTSVGRPVWSPGDTALAYHVRGDGGMSVRVHHVRSGTSGTLFSLPDRPMSFVDWSPDGRRILVTRLPGGAATSSGIWLYSLDDRRARPLLESSGVSYGDARFSPDGRWIAYTSTETGASEVWVRRVDGAGAPVRVSTAGGRLPVWRADGRELFFATPDQRVVAASVTLGEEARIGRSAVVVANPPDRLGFTMFQVTPDGQQVMLFQLRLPMELTVIQGWQGGLEAERRGAAP